MTDDLKSPDGSFLGKIEETFENLKQYLISQFGDHMSIHNAVSDTKACVITHAADHFGDPVPDLGGMEAAVNASLPVTSVPDPATGV